MTVAYNRLGYLSTSRDCHNGRINVPVNPFLQPGRYHYHPDDYGHRKTTASAVVSSTDVSARKLLPSWLRIECTSTISQELKSTINDAFPIDLNHHKSDPCVVVRLSAVAP